MFTMRRIGRPYHANDWQRSIFHEVFVTMPT
ncbi:hypothetical protein B23_0952 [Geobacillus thermoleovorans B23]|nr:hypothetical protein B23_0952 [Geobacillus thermoleovorans B23]